MEDKQIIELYFDRSEEAIGESAKKYGGYCRTIAGHILPNAADVEELRQKPLYLQLLQDRVFRFAVRIFRTETGREYAVEELPW